MVCQKAATYYRLVLFSAPNSISRLISAASPLWDAFLLVEIVLQVTEFVVNCVTSCHSQSKLPGACFIKVRRPTWRPLAVRDWELVLYKYANFSSLQSECPDSSGPYRPAQAGALLVRVRYRRANPTFAFFSLSPDPFFFFDIPPAPLLFFILSRRYVKMVLFLSILQ